MIYKHIIDEIEKYSFINRVEYGTNFYVTLFYNIEGVEHRKSITRRARPEQLQKLLIEIKEVADRSPDPKFDNEMPVEVIKYGN